MFSVPAKKKCMCSIVKWEYLFVRWNSFLVAQNRNTHVVTNVQTLYVYVYMDQQQCFEIAVLLRVYSRSYVNLLYHVHAKQGG